MKYEVILQFEMKNIGNFVYTLCCKKCVKVKKQSEYGFTNVIYTQKSCRNL